MNKSVSSVVIAIIVLAILIGGGIAIFHKSSKPNPSTATSLPSVNNTVLITKTSSSLGKYLAEPNGQTLYTYGQDTSGVSNCTGSCLANWPAYQDKGSTTGLPAGVGTITRSDNGEIQYTYNGMPLYTFVDDHNGQVTGNGVSNFSVAKPVASPTSTSSQPSGSTNNSMMNPSPTTTPNYSSPSQPNSNPY